MVRRHLGDPLGEQSPIRHTLFRLCIYVVRLANDFQGILVDLGHGLHFDWVGYSAQLNLFLFFWGLFMTLPCQFLTSSWGFSPSISLCNFQFDIINACFQLGDVRLLTGSEAV